MKEQWKDIPGFVGTYQASNLGRIRRLTFKNRRTEYKLDSPRLISPSNSGNGYLRVCLYDHGRKTQASIHRLVLMSFVGPCPDDFECAHLNGTRGDNRLDNLAWVSKRDNQSHRWDHGTMCFGEKQGTHKLTEADVLKINELIKAGAQYKVIAKKFHVNASNISRIARGLQWAYLRKYEEKKK